MTSGETENTNTQNQRCPARPRRATPSAGRQLRAASVLVPVLLAALLGPASAAAEQGATAQPANPIRLAQASEIREFSIRPQPLASALDRFSEATGISFAYTTSQLDGIRSPGVSGALPPRQALAQLLAGTGITFQFTGADTVTLALAQEGDGPLRTDPILVGGEAASGTGAVEGFRAESSTSATNVDAPLIETPATVNVLTGDFIDTIGARRIEEMLQYVPGASAESANATGNQFNIRGFRMTSGGGGTTTNIRIDDNRVQARRYHFDPTLYERIDVLKGNASLLYGTAAPGGVVRYVTKKPQFESRHRVEATLGSFETTRGTVDSTGPLGDNVAYRIIATALDSNQSFHGDNDDRSFDDRLIFNPQLTWLTPGGGELRVSYEYSDHDNGYDPGIKRLSDGSFTFNSEPFSGPDNFQDRENHIGVVDFTQPIGENWQVQVGGSIGRTDIDALWDFASGNPDATDQIARFTRRFTEDAEHEELRAELSGRFNTGSLLQHNLTVGASYRSTEQINNNAQRFAAGEIDARNPVFGPAPDVGPSTRFFSNELQEMAVYIQDYISVGEKLNLFGGLRYTDAEINQSIGGPGFGASNDGSDDALDYTIGAIYNQNYWLNPFVSYSTALTPQTGALSGSGDAVPFREGEQIELGLKSEWFDGRLATTLSVFEIEQTNIAEGDPANPGFLILAGNQRTRGFEFEAVGQITDQISIFGGYSYLDAEFTESTTGNKGNTPASVPEHKFSIFGEYAFTGDLEGWRAGVGFIHVGDRETDSANTFELPNYERVDLSLAYERGPFDFRASIENVLDEDYIIGSDFGGVNLAQGAPRFFTLTAGWEF